MKINDIIDIYRDIDMQIKYYVKQFKFILLSSYSLLMYTYKAYNDETETIL